MSAIVPAAESRASSVSRSAHARERSALRFSADLWIALLAIAAILLHLGLRLSGAASNLYTLPLWIALGAGGLPLVYRLLRALIRGEFGSDLLAGLSIVTSAMLGEYLVGAIVVLMLSGGSALEAFATRRASAVLEALAKRVPKVAHRRSAESVQDVNIADVQIGDLLVVYPHEICPVDGEVKEGHGRMNEAYLTGEPFEISKAPGASVLSGAVNGESALVIRATRLPVDSRYARIMRVMEEAEQSRPRMRRIGDRIGAWYTPAAVLVACLAWLLSGERHRFLAVLVIATPCPVLIAIPVTVIGAISLAARRGIIIKNPAMLERVDTCRTVIFDKTGTLTYGRPSLTDVICSNGFTETQVLSIAGAMEQYSKHPLAHSILERVRNQQISLASVEQVSEPPGEGLRAFVSGKTVELTGRRQLEELGTPDLPAPSAGMECFLLVNHRVAALFRFRDEPRNESRSFVGHLRPHHRVTRVMLLSGDRELEARHLAAQVGITEVLSGQSPEDKVATVAAESAKQPTLFVGDGINDAPAMQAATVGVAFGHHNEITAEAADAVLLDPALNKVDELMHIGARMRRIALQSALGGMALSFLGIAAAAFGYLDPVPGAVAQEVIDLLAVLNAVRVSIPPPSLVDF